GKPTAWASCDPSLGKHGGAASLAQFSRLSGCTEARREIREVQHRRGQWFEIAVAHTCPLDNAERFGKRIPATNRETLARLSPQATKPNYLRRNTPETDVG